jgi:hypothetical protein
VEKFEFLGTMISQNYIKKILVRLSRLGGVMVSVLPLDSRFAYSNAAEGDGILRTTKSAACLPLEEK